MADPNGGSRETELVLAPNEHAFVLDRTKGNVNVITGPNKTSLSTSDSPVIFDVVTKRFTAVNLDKSIRPNITAPKGWYVILKNPSKDGRQPATGSNQSLSGDTLTIGQKVNISGPAGFSLWPGQIAKVVRGHTLCSNQYLVARVYDEDAAKQNWSKAVIKNAVTVVPSVDKTTADGTDKLPLESDTKSDAAEQVVPQHTEFNPGMLVTGQILIIQGTDVSFYIPPTGIEVEADAESDNGTVNYVRDAVTLERLEYCILKDENGNKRYVKGPNVVFPSPTEQFLTGKNGRKFRAVELNEQSGLYIKVIEDYEDESGVAHRAGDELFITGKTQSIYFPCSQHAIIKYGDQEKHFAVAIPAGEARYVLNRDTGGIKLLNGPFMYLPDPRKEVIVRRILEDKECNLLYPGNTEALEYNRKLRTNRIGFSNYVEDTHLKVSNTIESSDNAVYGLSANSLARALASSSMSDELIGSRSFKNTALRGAKEGNEMNRGTSYTPPRTLTLDNKYEGAVTVNVYTGYAIQVVNKSGSRRVVVGPCTVLLEYDEYLEEMKLSTGRPKNTDTTISTAYLRVLNNRVSDSISVVTEDLIEVKIELKYLIKFDGDSSKWFNIDNYVQYMSHHMRSMITNAVRKQKAAAFNLSGIDLIRDLVLGPKDNGGERVGRAFKENGMVIYEVEVMAIDIMDATIRNLLVASHQEALKGEILVSGKTLELERTAALENVIRGIASEKTTTSLMTLAAAQEVNALTDAVNQAKQKAKFDLEASLEQQVSDITKVRLLRELEVREVDNEQREILAGFTERATADYLKRITGEADSYVTKGGVVTPQLVAAISALAQGQYLNNLGELAPLSIVQGSSLEGTLHKLFKGTPLETLGENIKSLAPLPMDSASVVSRLGSRTGEQASPN